MANQILVTSSIGALIESAEMTPVYRSATRLHNALKKIKEIIYFLTGQ